MNNPTVIDRIQRAGCWAVGFYTLAAFFAVGFMVSLLNADILTALQSVIMMALFGLLAWWLAQKRKQGEKRSTRDQPR